MNTIHVRQFQPQDRAFVLNLAPRLTIGMPSWRDPQACLGAIQGWVKVSLEQHGRKTMIFIAEDEAGDRPGFATVTAETHFTGEEQAYMGELAVSEAAEGRGVGKALVQACESWAHTQGFHILALTTGAANSRALDFYHHLGYLGEDIRLVKILKK